ncbi:MAG: peptidoglycan bridge formation glycyltransferase FemA/FemB family protein [Candidatus Daviesbacteria bacterium]|nr:peptidoglycan bridge formation glycyltransferase FemA/FemB family protein [Candidatus Daviesbacteria bacterium]
MDLRQWPQYGNFLSLIGWKVEKTKFGLVFIHKIPLLNCSVIKIQRPKNPIDFKKIDEIAKSYHALFIIIEPSHKNFQVEKFNESGFVTSHLTLAHTSTIYVDLNLSEKNLWKTFSENARRNIRKSQANNLKIKIIDLSKESDDQEFKKFFSLLKNLTEMKKFYVPGYDEYYKKFLSFKNNSFLFFAYQDTELIAGIWIGYYRKTTVYMQTGITKTGYEKLANYLLVWEAFKKAKRLKVKTFDFEGIFDPRLPHEHKSWKSFSEFKKRFHGEIIEYPLSQIKIYNPFFKLIYFLSKFLPV